MTEVEQQRRGVQGAVEQLGHGVGVLGDRRARPSMRSLHRIATALGTTQQALLAAAAGDGPGDTGQMLDVGGGGARLILHEPAGVDVTEFVGLPREFEDFFEHPRAELLYVARGRWRWRSSRTGAVRGRCSGRGTRSRVLVEPGTGTGRSARRPVCCW
ncbi:hypothetical protein [Pseudonocardia thermophila]|uniref:hypothetical protein n=1 Tax=Pseudonocardia thermophila TaxID=1848 RepID=UPI0011610C38|nr:hypothetical protein [Pseudonocardia thermophila]